MHLSLILLLYLGPEHVAVPCETLTDQVANPIQHNLGKLPLLIETHALGSAHSLLNHIFRDPECSRPGFLPLSG